VNLSPKTKKTINSLGMILIVLMPFWATVLVTWFVGLIEMVVQSSSGAFGIFCYSLIPIFGYIPITNIKSLAKSAKILLFIPYYIFSAVIIFVVAWVTIGHS